MNDLSQVIPLLAVYALPVIFGITAHQAGQAFAAYYFGDNSAFAAGRMTLNPLRHIDLFGTVVLPVLLLLFTPFVFGYARPIPLDFSRLRNPKKQMALVVLAGPLACFASAFLWMLLGELFNAVHISESFPHEVAKAGALVNVLMFVFYLLPIPPLDGGRILISFLPVRQAIAFAKLEPYGILIVLALLYLGVLNYWFVPMMAVAGTLLGVLIFPFQFLLN